MPTAFRPIPDFYGRREVKYTYALTELQKDPMQLYDLKRILFTI